MRTKRECINNSCMVKHMLGNNHEAEVLNLRRVVEELENLFRNENFRSQQGNRESRDNILLQFLNLLKQILKNCRSYRQYSRLVLYGQIQTKKSFYILNCKSKKCLEYHSKIK
jgi:hypothetical protein